MTKKLVSTWITTKVIDVFRYCIKRYPHLAKLLDKQTEGFDNTQNMETAQFGANTAVAPQPSLIEVDTQSNLDKL